MKWICDKCQAINPQFAFKCHCCGKLMGIAVEVIVTDSTAGGKK